MSGLKEKRELSVDEVGLLDGEHIDKKLKLSNVGEPLTRKDLKLFQKDVLFRNLKEYKMKYLALKETIVLNQDVEKLKEYYEQLYHELERENSEVVQRVMGKAKSDELKAEEEKKVSVSPEPASVLPGTSSVGAESEAASANEIEALKKDIEEVTSDLRVNELQNKIDELHMKLENSLKSTEDITEELKKKNIACAEQNRVFESNSIEVERLKAQLESSALQFKNLTEEHKTVLKRLNIVQINPSGAASLKSDVPDKFAESLNVINESLLRDLQGLQKNLARIRSERDHLKSENNILASQTRGVDILEELQKEIKHIKATTANFEKTHGSVTSDNDLLEELKSIELAYNELAGSKLDTLAKLILDKQQVEKTRFDFEKLKEKYASISRLLQDSKVHAETLKKVKIKADELIADYEIKERVTKGRLNNLERQLETSREVEKFVQLSNKEILAKLEVAAKEVGSLKAALKTKDSLLLSAGRETESLKNAKQELERKVSETAELQAKQDKRHRNLLSKLKQASDKVSNPDLVTHVFGNTQLSELAANGNDSAAQGNSALQDQLDNFKQLVYCPLCTRNFKSQMIKNCGHTFCESCIKERLGARMRKCPSCNLPFGSTDVLDIVL